MQDGAQELDAQQVSIQLEDNLSKQISVQLTAQFEKEKEEMYEHLKVSFRSAQRDQAEQFREEAAEQAALHKSKQAQMRKALQEKCKSDIRDLEARHKAAEVHWETMLARRNRDSKLFTFTVQGCEGPGLSGCVPRQIFEAEPNSALAHIYNGEWEYTTDVRGRAVVNSDPAHWGVIIRWLSFGTVPANPTPELLSKCRYWQLDRLLAAIDAARNGKPSQQGCQFRVRRATTDGYCGFRAETSVQDFQQQLVKAGDDGSWLALPFKAIGRDWTLKMKPTDICLGFEAGSPLRLHLMRIDWGTGSFTEAARYVCRAPLKCGATPCWPVLSETIELLLGPQLVAADGSMPLAITMSFHPSPNCPTA